MPGLGVYVLLAIKWENGAHQLRYTDNLFLEKGFSP